MTKEIIILHVVRSFVYEMQHVIKNVIYRRLAPSLMLIMLLSVSKLEQELQINRVKMSISEAAAAAL